MKTKDAYNKLKKRQTWLFILLFLWIGIVFLLSPAQAQTIQMSNPGSIGARDITVYNSTGSLYGSYNTTSLITLDQNQSYVFMLKPQTSNAIDDPGEWLTETAFPYVRTNILAIILVVFCIGLLILAGRR
jgi:hypothetical protein